MVKRLVWPPMRCIYCISSLLLVYDAPRQSQIIVLYNIIIRRKKNKRCQWLPRQLVRQTDEYNQSKKNRNYLFYVYDKLSLCSFDYGEKFWIIKYKHFTCMCGSSKCKYSSETIQTTLENYNKKIKEHQQEEGILENGSSSIGC